MEESLDKWWYCSFSCKQNSTPRKNYWHCQCVKIFCICKILQTTCECIVTQYISLHGMMLKKT